jgi:hypothetical protein
MLTISLKVLFPVCVFALSATQTSSGAGLRQDLIDCRETASSAARLDCYDRLADAHTASPGDSVDIGTDEIDAPADATAPAAAVTAAEAATPAVMVSQEELFGKSGAEVRKSVQEATDTEEVDEIAARISKIRKSGSGYLVITLDNGQVWKQTDSSRLRLSDNDVVTIHRAALGSFMLRKADGKTTMRVKRIS